MENQIFEVFLEALRQIFTETGIRVNAVESADERDMPDQVVTSVGITGAMKGNFMLCTDYPSAIQIVRSMMGGVRIHLPGKGLGEIPKTALGEIANQISGRAVTILWDRRIECEITPPIIITAERLTSHFPDLSQSFSRVVKGPFGSLRILLAMSAPAGEKTS